MVLRVNIAVTRIRCFQYAFKLHLDRREHLWRLQRSFVWGFQCWKVQGHVQHKGKVLRPWCLLLCCFCTHSVHMDTLTDTSCFPGLENLCQHSLVWICSQTGLLWSQCARHIVIAVISVVLSLTCWDKTLRTSGNKCEEKSCRSSVSCTKPLYPVLYKHLICQSLW